MEASGAWRSSIELGRVRQSLVELCKFGGARHSSMALGEGRRNSTELVGAWWSLEKLAGAQWSSAEIGEAWQRSAAAFWPPPRNFR